MMLFQIGVVILCLSHMTWAHSWVACADYKGAITGRDYSDKLCRGWIRGWIRSWERKTAPTYPDNNEFGDNRGIAYRIAVGNGKPICLNKMEGNAGNGYSAAYRDGKNMPRYTVGQTVRLVWPAKNHVNYDCFKGVPDTSMKLFMNPKVNPTKDLPNTAKTMPGNGWKLVKDWQKGCTPGDKGCGFQNCPKFCMNTDDATCFGDFVVPRVARSGYYTFAWYWAWEPLPKAPYTSCFEAYIDVSKNGAGIKPNLPSAGDNFASKERDGKTSQFSFCITKRDFNFWQLRDVVRDVFKGEFNNQYLNKWGHRMEIKLVSETKDSFKFMAEWMHPKSKTATIRNLARNQFCKEYTRRWSWTTCSLCGESSPSQSTQAVAATPSSSVSSVSSNSNSGNSGNSGSGNQRITILNGKDMTNWYFPVVFQNIAACKGRIRGAQVYIGKQWKWADDKWAAGPTAFGFGFRYKGTKYGDLLPIKLRLAMNDGSYILFWNAVKNLNVGSKFTYLKTCNSKQFETPYDSYNPFDDVNPVQTYKPSDPSEFVISFTWQDLAIFGLVCVNLVVLALVIRWKCCTQSTSQYGTVKMMADSEDELLEVN